MRKEEKRLRLEKLCPIFIFLEDKAVKSDIIIVPGSSQINIIKKAVDLYKLGFSKKIIFTGSFNEKIQKYESEFGKEYALSMGVNKKDIYVENKSTNTKENAVYARKIIDKYGLSSNKIILPCKTYHSMRVKMTFVSEFPKSKLIIMPVIDQRNITKNNWWKDDNKLEIVMEEVEKIGKYFLKGDLVW